MEEQNILEGAISISAVLRSGSREIFSVMIREGREEGQVRRIADTAQRRGILVQRLSADEIDARASGKTHGGIIAMVGPRKFMALHSLLAASPAFIVMVDGVEDPYNFGAAVRSLYAAGAQGLVVRPRNWMSAASVVARSSAGASELIPTAISESAEEAAQFYRERGLLVACATDSPPTANLYRTDLSSPLFLLIGGEKRGVTRSFASKSDIRLEIPYARSDSHSLGTAAAAAVIGFEIMRQRQNISR